MKTTETQTHRALADPRRASLLAELRAAPAGLGVQDLADRLALHPNTVRWHLGVLADAGLAMSHAAPHGRGRPRAVWTAARSERSENYRLLATILTGALADAPAGAERAEAAGRAWGRFLVERPEPFSAPPDAVGSVVSLLDGEGFAASAEAGVIRMRRCPFHELAETHGRVVCAVHRGVIDGALTELGATVEVDELRPFVAPGLCVAALRARRN